MPGYQGLKEFENGRMPRLGVVVVNPGTAESPTPAAVHRNLGHFILLIRLWLILPGSSGRRIL
jgi:hypothetical protein